MAGFELSHGECSRSNLSVRDQCANNCQMFGTFLYLFLIEFYDSVSDCFLGVFCYNTRQILLSISGVFQFPDMRSRWGIFPHPLPQHPGPDYFHKWSIIDWILLCNITLEDGRRRQVDQMTQMYRSNTFISLKLMFAV